MIALRDYQTRAIEALRAERRKGHRRLLLVSPTGSGKTAMACSVIATALAFGQRVLVIAHRKELLDQFWGHLRVHHDIVAGLMRADDERTDPGAPVQLASIMTLTRRELPPADLIIVDEAHRTPSESYQRALEAYPRATVIGLTATPCRLDGRPLREHFDAMVTGARYDELIDSGAILAPVVYAAERDPDLSKVKRMAGDYHEGQLEQAMMQPQIVGNVVDEWVTHAEKRASVVFAVGVDHSRELVERFRERGIASAHLDGGTPESEREDLLVQLELGKLRVLSNVGVLCEGWDQPRVKCAVIARPTLSLSLWMQMAGRILRPWGDKPPVLLDHAGNVERHGLPHENREWSLTEGTAKRAATDRYRVCAGCYAYVERMPCPLCGHATARKPREVREAKGQLRVVGGGPPVDPKRAFYDAQVTRASKQGFKPGFAAAKYKERFGAWPPWDWSQTTKRTFENDEEWKGRVEKRTREREFWQQKHEAREPEPAFTEEPEEGGVFDGV